MDQALPIAHETTGAAASSRAVLRLLGRLLGDVIRETQGQATFDQIEQIRTRSVGEHRRGETDAGLGALLRGLSLKDMLLLIRGFAIFSQLANIADDHIMRREAFGQPSPLARLRLDAASPQARRFLNQAVVTPVITAHPTEVRRKSTLDRETAIAALLDATEVGSRSTAAEIETALKREIRILWQTRMLRSERITVADEIDNAVSFFQLTFLPEIPALKRRLASLFGLEGPLPASCFQLGSWVGGDRDGKPFRRRGHPRPAPLRLPGPGRDRLAARSAAGPGRGAVALRRVRGDQQRPGLPGGGRPGRQSAPRRRAPTGGVLVNCYGRPRRPLRAKLLGTGPVRASAITAPAYADPAELAADLAVVAESLAANQAADIAQGRLLDVREAVTSFGFIWRWSTCARTRTCTSGWSPSC